MATNTRSGGQVLIDALRIHGVDRVFCVPGESYLAALDALHDADDIDLIVCRQEGGAAYMAEAYGKFTGKPGICFVTRGPGATNASIGVHTAYQDSSPMVLFIGQVARDQRDREAFQEIDYRKMYAPIAKWVVEIDQAERIPELVSQAFHRAMNGRPGPVVVSLPEDMLMDQVSVKDALAYRRAEMGVSPSQLEELRDVISGAHRPLMIVGGGGWTADAVDDIRAFSEAMQIPVAASFRCQDLFDNAHPNYAGDLGFAASAALNKRVKESDCLIVVGARLGETTTAGYTLVEIPTPRQTIVHVHASADELGRVYRAALPINADVVSFAHALRSLTPIPRPVWSEWTKQANRDYLANLVHPKTPGDVQMGDIMAWLRDELPVDALLTTGAGNYATWVHRFYQYRTFRTQLGPTNGSMGYGVPAAIAAKLTDPERMVIAFAGDGCFLMNGQELATAIQYNVPIIILVVNNGMYGTIRMHQERRYPGRVSGTQLVNPDFAALARSYGAHGETVQKTADFAPAFGRALASGKPALIEIRIDPEALTPKMSLSEIRHQAEQQQVGA